MTKRFEVLDSFRGLCAISVMIFHMHIYNSITELSFFRESFIFVDFFFILSGFVLAHSYAFSGNVKFSKFIKSRFFRIYPLHFFMFIVMLSLEACKLLAYKKMGVAFNTQPFTGSNAVSEIIPNILLIQSWLPFADSLSFNYPSWSISVEFWTYVIFFISISIFANKKIVTWFSISILMMFFLTFNTHPLPEEVIRGLFGFFGGAILYSAFKKFNKHHLGKKTSTIIEILLLSLILSVLSFEVPHKHLLSSILFFVTIFFFAFEAGYVSSFFKLKPFQKVGALSYSIYMTHAAILFIVISIAMIIQKKFHLNTNIMIDGVRLLDTGNTYINNCMVLIISIVVIVTSYFTNKYIEKKFSSSRRV